MIEWCDISPVNAKINPICHLLALLGAHHILHVGRKRVNVRRDVQSDVGSALRPVHCGSEIHPLRVLVSMCGHRIPAVCVCGIVSVSE